MLETAARKRQQKEGKEGGSRCRQECWQSPCPQDEVVQGNMPCRWWSFSCAATGQAAHPATKPGSHTVNREGGAV